MRDLATVLCVTLSLAGAGCASRGSARTASGPGSLSGPAPRYSAVSPGARVAGDPSRGSAAFGNFVRAREPQLQFCYREARTTTPDLVGSATVVVTLDDGGTVSDARVVRHSWSTPGAAKVVEGCMLDRVRSWRFPSVDPRDEHVHSFAVIFSS